MYIKVNISGQQSSYFELVGEENSLGRSKDCDIRVRHLDVSRKHLSFIMKDDQIRVIDHNSTNGVQLNSSPLKPLVAHSVLVGHKLSLGKNITIEIIDKETPLSEDVRLNPEDKTVPGLDFTLGEERTVANMNLNSILSSLNKQDDPERSENLEPQIKSQKIKMPKIFNKEDKLVSSKAPFYKAFGFIAILVILVVQKDNILSLFSEPKQVVATSKRVKPKTSKKIVKKKSKSVAQDLSYLLKASTCQSTLEKILCDSVNATRKLKASEGFLELNDKLYYIMNQKSAAMHYHKSLKYNQAEVNMLASVLQSDKGLKINMRQLQSKGYVINRIGPTNYNNSYLSILDFTFSDAGQVLVANKIKEVIVIVGNKKKEISLIKPLSATQIKFIFDKKDSLSPFLKFYFISGYSRETDRVFSKVKILGLKKD